MYPALIGGQLLTPITNSKVWSPCYYGVDNGAYTGFNEARWFNLVARVGAGDGCIFVTLPDVVGSHKKTMELWTRYTPLIPHVPRCFVLQDGCDEIPIGAVAVFLGGSTSFKMSRSAAELVAEARRRGMHVHVGRVNTTKRYLHFRALGADTCDGTGVLKYPHMLRDLAKISFVKPFWEN